MNINDLDEVHLIECSAHKSPWSKEIIRDCIFVGYDCFILEEKEHNQPNSIIGYVISRAYKSEYHILNFCITPSKQAQGLGTYFLHKILQKVDNNSHLAYVTLEVRPSNIAAMQLYKHFNFKQSSIKKEYYKDKQGTEDALVLIKNFR